MCGALMPEKREFPRLVSMHDPVLDAVRARTAETGRGEAWIAARNLEAAYDGVVSRLEKLSKDRIAAATIAKGDDPALVRVLCCEEPACT